MDAVIFAVPACGMNVAVGPGALFLDTAVADVKSQTYAIHIERFSMSTHTSTVFPAVSATLLLGSDIAHTQLAYADGSLWLYAARNGPEVLRGHSRLPLAGGRGRERGGLRAPRRWRRHGKDRATGRGLRLGL
jgi:hypothetical protein